MGTNGASVLAAPGPAPWATFVGFKRPHLGLARRQATEVVARAAQKRGRVDVRGRGEPVRLARREEKPRGFEPSGRDDDTRGMNHQAFTARGNDTDASSNIAIMSSQDLLDRSVQQDTNVGVSDKL
jgi:hypothetical protein